MNVPYVERPCEGTNSAGVEYQEEDVQDHVFQAVLRQSYNTFRVCQSHALKYFLTGWQIIFRTLNTDVLYVARCARSLQYQK